MSTKETKKFYVDYALVAIILLFMVLSLIAIDRSGIYLGYSTRGLALRQGIWYVIGFVVILVMIRLSPDILSKIMRIAYFVLLIMLFGLLVVKYIPALHSPLRFLIEDRNGAYAWYTIPGGLGTFQPSEFMKIVLIFVSADIIHNHNSNRPQATFVSDLKLFFKIALWAVPPLLLNFLQPDTGIPIIIVVSLIFMIYVGATKNYWFLGILVLLVLLYFGTIYLYYNHPDILGSFIGGTQETQYKLGRFYGWLEYEKYAQSYGYQLYNALIGLGMGGSTGIVDSTFVVHIAEAQNDFIFSVIGSQFGIVGTLSVVALCVLLNVKLIYTAVMSVNTKAKYILGGLLGIFMFQQLQNMGMLVGLMPITGITLPLISSGGSSLISYMIGLAYAFMVHDHTKKNPVYEESKMPSIISKKTS
jgi:rod shape determining protein RodA